jgi:CheY-like chemotaxis protein
MLLIVDDNSQVRRMIHNLIEDLESEIYECEDGEQALSAYVEHQPDWVLMDVRMKRVDGLTATRQIKRIFPAAKIIIVTNHTDRKIRQAAKDAGACAFVSKDNLIGLRDLIGAGGEH